MCMLSEETILRQRKNSKRDWQKIFDYSMKKFNQAETKAAKDFWGSVNWAALFHKGIVNIDCKIQIV